MKTITVQVYEDVKARLEENREHKNESINDILRRVLDMNEPTDPYKGMIPIGYRAQITKGYFVNNESKNWEFLESLSMCDDEKQDMLSGNFGINTQINGVSVRFSLESILELEINAETEDELCQQIQKVKEVLPFELDEKQVQIWKHYRYSESIKTVQEAKP